MPYCKHYREEVTGSSHNCKKKGLLNVHEDDSFLVSTLVRLVIDSALLGGDIVGGVVGDLLDGDLFD